MICPTTGTFLLTTAALLGLAACTENAAKGQCATCVTPTVAYSPVVVPTTTVVQPTIVRTGWYPGWLLDRLRLNRWAVTAPVYTTSYAPAYQASYAPTYTASYAPAPYVAAYAPLPTTVVQTSYYAPAAPSCVSCATPAVTTNYAPTVVYRPITASPVVQTAFVEAVPSCCPADPCGACAACATTVSTASYVDSAVVTTPACPSCAPATSSEPTFTTPSSGASSGSASTQTPPPSLPADYQAPATPHYGSGSQTPASGGAAQPPNTATPAPQPDDGAVNGSTTPGSSNPASPGTGASDPTTYWNLEAPPLIGPRNGDRTANRPTVEIHDAVFRQPARTSQASTAAQPAGAASAWYSVSERQ